MYGFRDLLGIRFSSEDCPEERIAVRIAENKAIPMWRVSVGPSRRHRWDKLQRWLDWALDRFDFNRVSVPFISGDGFREDTGEVTNHFVLIVGQPMDLGPWSSRMKIRPVLKRKQRRHAIRLALFHLSKMDMQIAITILADIDTRVQEHQICLASLAAHFEGAR